MFSSGLLVWPFEPFELIEISCWVFVARSNLANGHLRQCTWMRSRYSNREEEGTAAGWNREREEQKDWNPNRELNGGEFARSCSCCDANSWDKLRVGLLLLAGLRYEFLFLLPFPRSYFSIEGKTKNMTDFIDFISRHSMHSRRRLLSEWRSARGSNGSVGSRGVEECRLVCDSVAVGAHVPRTPSRFICHLWVRDFS